MNPLHTQWHNPGAELTVAMLHGNSSCSSVFQAATRRWQHPSSVLLIDLPGHGQSPRYDTIADYRYHRLLTVLETTLRDVDGPLLLVGHSFGGHLAMDLAPRLPNLRGLVIVGAPPLRKPLNLAEAFRPMPNLDVFFSANPTATDVTSALRFLCPNQAHVPALQTWFASTDPAMRAATALDLAEGSLPDEVASLQALQVPKVVLYSESDPVPNLDYVRRLDAGLTLQKQPGQGHYLMLDAPDAFAATLVKIAG